MDWLVDFIVNAFYKGWLSCGLLALTWAVALVQMALIKYKKKRIFTPIRILLGGTFLSAVLYFTPILQELISTADRAFWLESVLNAFQYSFRLFVLDGEILWVLDEELALLKDPAVKEFYTVLGSFLYASAPILTFGFVLSFFNSAIAKVRYFLAGCCRTHVFSELNEKSLALATDIIKNGKIISFEKKDGKKKLKLSLKDVVVFTEISDKVMEDKLDLVEDARMLGAIMFRKDFDSIIFKRKLSLRPLSFYLISDDESKKLRHAEVVMKNFDYKGVELRLFSADIRSELFMASSNVEKMRAIRIDDIQTLIYHNLYTHGKMLFDRSREVEGEKDKVISAVIVGLGQYGAEMLKALTWFCQLDGYKLKITAFDSDEKAEEKFKFLCPELMHEDYNGKIINGEPYYDITIHSGIDVSTPDFRKKLEAIKDASYIFVCLGTDEINLKTAIDIRSICESIDYGSFSHKPDIETVVYDSKLAGSLGVTWNDLKNGKKAGVTNFKDTPYNILITGDLESFYSVSTLVDSQLIAAGFEIQLDYSVGKDEKKRKDPKARDEAERCFWKYEYNHNSSIAKAIHLKLRGEMGRLDSYETWDDLPREEKIALSNPEHIRWNAYMRTIGYSKGKRNDLGRRHHNLVPTGELSDADLRKD